MSFLSDSSIICLSCRQRHMPYDIYTSVDTIGICNFCYKKLRPIKNLTPTIGVGKVKYVVSPFFYNYEMKNIIHRYKFFSEWKIGELLSKILYDQLKDESFWSEFDLITAIPLSKNRLHTRGYNQSELVAKLLSKKIPIKYETCVYRRKDTASQRLLNKFSRRYNVTNAFVADKEKVTGKKILIFDDIYTTGSTMSSCAEVLINNGALGVAGLSFAIATHHVK